MTSKIKISEIFYSLQGEGLYVGTPSIFLRTFGCNLKCEGFGMPSGEKSQERLNVILPAEAKSIHDLPLVSTGCDSYASWDPRFKRLSPKMTVNEIADELILMLPENKWKSSTGTDIHLVITGGEPLLGWQKAYCHLFNQQSMVDLRHVTFETNGTQPLLAEAYEGMAATNISFTFSVSPKLSVSGEPHSKAIKPEVVNGYSILGDTYLKFVADDESQFSEIRDVVSEYRDAGWSGDVYIMPTGGLQEMYQKNAAKIANLCLKYGYKYSPRLHVDLFGNNWAT